eukprot:7022444-Pyramimonas_sp.AAC.1
MPRESRRGPREAWASSPPSPSPTSSPTSSPQRRERLSPPGAGAFVEGTRGPPSERATSATRGALG